MWPWKIGIQFLPTEKGLSIPPADFTITEDSLESNPFRFSHPAGPKAKYQHGRAAREDQTTWAGVHNAPGCNTKITFPRCLSTMHCKKHIPSPRAGHWEGWLWLPNKAVSRSSQSSLLVCRMSFTTGLYPCALSRSPSVAPPVLAQDSFA